MPAQSATGPWGYIAAASVGALSAGGLRRLPDVGRHGAPGRHAEAQRRDVRDACGATALATTRASDAATFKVELDVDTAMTNLNVIHETTIKKVPVYVTRETDARFPVPCGFVRLHDAAALGADPDTVPNPPGKSDGDACEIASSAVATAVVDNYALANKWREQLIGWQAWAKAQEAVSP